MRLWIDDVRPMPEGFDFWAKNFYEAVGILMTEPIDYVSFDHDLGHTGKPEKTGYSVASFIEEMAVEYFGDGGSKILQPIEWDIHSANSAGRHNIELAMKSAERFWNGG